MRQTIRAPLNIVERQAFFPHVCPRVPFEDRRDWQARECAICSHVQKQWLAGKYDRVRQ